MSKNINTNNTNGQIQLWSSTAGSHAGKYQLFKDQSSYTTKKAVFFIL